MSEMIAPQKSNNPNVVYEPLNGKEKTKVNAARFSRSKVLKWLSLGIGVTGLVAIVLSDLLVYFLTSGIRSPEAFSTTRIASIVVSCVVRLPARVIVGVKSFSDKSGLMITGYRLYSISMGVILSFVFRVVRIETETPSNYIWVLSLTFLVTAAIFLLFGIISNHVSKNLPRLLIIGTTRIGTILVLSLCNIFLQSAMIYWIREGARFFIRRLVIAIDRSNVKRRAESKIFSSNTNRAIYCAYQLYVDFIWVFLRLLMLFASISSKKK